MSSINALLIAYLTTGFSIGFGHCIGMCGPLVVSFSLRLKDRNILIPHMLYHCGRIITYMVLGGIMGAVGSFTIVAANIALIQKSAMLFAGALIVFMGLSMTGWVPQAKIFGFSYSPTGKLSGWVGNLSQTRFAGLYLPIGLILGLLPCGPVYTALIGAVRAGMESPTPYRGVLIGMVLMFAFGIGTVPALFLVAKLVDMGWLKSRDSVYRIGALLMIGVGIYFLVSAFRY